MKLLLSNDDGVFADGIRALCAKLYREHEVSVSAPDVERSCVSRAMTLFSPLRAKRVELVGLSEVPAYAVSGTPVDCVRLGMGNLFGEPDMVISGINIGSNLGTDALYSGTVAAAHEAALLGIPAIAVSICSFHPKHLDAAAEFALRAVDYVSKNKLPFGTVLNVNVPDLAMEDIKGVKLVPAGVVQYKLAYIERKDPSGEPYYWPPRGRLPHDPDLLDDERFAAEGYVTVTPLTYDLTNFACMRDLPQPDWMEKHE